MPDDCVFEQMAGYGVVPVVAIDSVDAATAMGDALIEGGLPIAEITFRTAAAAEVIGTLARERRDLLVGAGTVLSIENLEAAKACGARFGVAPGLNPDVVTRARQIGLPFVPGVATPSEIERALSLGCRLLKFFPSEALGGIAMIKALAGPYRHTGLRLVPTGGVNAGNLDSYLSLDVVAAVGGTWIATRDALASGDWHGIRDRCRAVGALVERLRGSRAPCSE
jgi:2-dehydro-3-deoxyphosphogluconate aldolase/(4S)-4-hydroxy-2-oxoglutarate aldolase